MTTTGGHHLQMPLTDLASHILELSQAESVQFIRCLRSLRCMHCQLQYEQSTGTNPDLSGSNPWKNVG